MAKTAQPSLLHGNTLEVVGFGVEMGYLDRREGEAFGGDGRVAAGGQRSGANLVARPHPHAFLNFPGGLSAAWWAMQDIADDLTDRFSSVVQQRR